MTSKIVQCTSIHKYNDTRIFYKECATLKDAGYNVVLIAPHERDENINGIQIRAIPKCNNRLERFTVLLYHIYRICTKEDAIVYHFHDPELIIVGLLLAIKKKIIILDIHEDLPRQVLTKSWIPFLLRHLVALLVRFIELLSFIWIDGFVLARSEVLKRFPKNKSILLRNFPRLDEFIESNFVPYHNRPFWLVYIGGLTRNRGINEMVKSLEPLLNSQIRLKLAGEFEPYTLLHEIAQFDGWRNVDYLGWLSRTKIAELLGNSRIGISILHPIPNYINEYPTKLFEYMAARLPVISSDLPLCRQVINEAKCGILVDPNSIESITKAIEYLYSHPDLAEVMGNNGRKAVEEQYNWNIESKKLLLLYRDIISNRLIKKNSPI